MNEYIINGASLGLLIDRKKRSVHVYRLGQAIEVLENPELVSFTLELPGFNLQMQKI